MPSHDRLLVLPADPDVSFEFVPTADVAAGEVPQWVEARLGSAPVQCDNVGKALVSWSLRGPQRSNSRAFALWYASIGSETGQIGPVPPAYAGTVIFEAVNANLQTARIGRFLRSKAARTFTFRGSHPSIEEFRPLVVAWNSDSPAL